MTTYHAGGEDKLRVDRNHDSRKESVQYERRAAATILPGKIVTPTTDADGETYSLHDGTAADDVHVALEARGRGMNANDDTGYMVDDLVYGRDASGGSFNLRVADGEDVTETDPLVIDTSGNLAVYVSADDDVTDVVGHAAEDADLTSASDPELVEVDME